MQATNNLVVETLEFVKKFSGQRLLIKLGGSILDDMTLVKKLCVDLSLLRAAGISVVIVHGGSKAIDKNLQAHQITSTFHQGLRVTGADMIELIEMVLSGHVNKMLVRTLNSVGVTAVGLSGVDSHMFHCSYFSQQHGFVGQIESVDASLIEYFLSTQTSHSIGTIPVISPIGMDEAGNALNINADWATCHIASALAIQKLIYLTDQDGIYDHNGDIISALDASQLTELINKNIVKAGMLTKVKTILNALDQGIDNIHIINAKMEHGLIAELFTNKGVGTVCMKRANVIRDRS